MPLTINNRPLLHRKKQERCNGYLLASLAAGSFLAGDKGGFMPTPDFQFLVNGASAIYQYSPRADSWQPLPNSGIAGAFGAGACGEFRCLGAPGGLHVNTATGGTTGTIITNKTAVKDIRGCRVRVVGGSGIGYEGKVASNTLGANAVVAVTPANAVAFDATTQYMIWSGSLWFFNAGTSAVGFSVLDCWTNTWTARSVTNLPTAWGTCGQLVATGSIETIVDEGTATAGAAGSLTDAAKLWDINKLAGLTCRIVRGTGAGQYRTISSNTATVITPQTNWTTAPDATSVYVIENSEVGTSTGTNTSTTLNDTTKAWTASQWINSQIRIVSGTGVGQIRAITASTTNQVTVAAWTVTPDATSVYVIEPWDDQMLLFGNNAVTAYRFINSTNTWATITPGVARAAAMGGGGTADYIGFVPDPLWYGKGDPANYRQAGRYVFSWRGAGSSLMDRFDVAGSTWINGANAGSAGSYGGQTETFTTGSCSVDADGSIYLLKEATGRIYRFDIPTFTLLPWYQSVEVNSTTVEGDKLMAIKYKDGGKAVKWIYFGMHSRQDFFRVMEVE